MTPDNNKNPWDQAAEGMSGLNEFIGEITGAMFMTGSEAYQQTSTFDESCTIVLECTVEQAIDPSDFEHETTRIILSVGKATNWLILDGGAKIQNSKGGGLGNSKYQLFISRVVKELNVPIKERGASPFEAAAWIGLKFHFAKEGRPIPPNLIKEGGKTESYTMLPKQWLQSAMPPLAVGA